MNVAKFLSDNPEVPLVQADDPDIAVKTSHSKGWLAAESRLNESGTLLANSMVQVDLKRPISNGTRRFSYFCTIKSGSSAEP